MFNVCLHDLYLLSLSIFTLPTAAIAEARPSGNPCLPSPCGPNSICRVIGNTPACSCIESYIGRPPNCRPECTINAECAGNLACINERCKDPCPGSCGAHASCVVLNHTPRCTCDPGYTGDPFSLCFIAQESKHIVLVVIDVYYLDVRISK